jgi:FkbM family methyltransferase
MAAIRRSAPLAGEIVDTCRSHWSQPRRELRRIQRQLAGVPRHRRGPITIFGKPTTYVDAHTFFTMYEDAFVTKANDFVCDSGEPVILDCGANIGLTVLRYKQLYPRATIKAFEPDPAICECLRANVASWGLTDVEVVQAAVWIHNDGIHFDADGSTGGSIRDGKGTFVPSVRLKDLIDRPVDFLKLDIEGAESAVIPDCGDLFSNVDAMIIEWHMRAGQPRTLGRSLEVLAEAGHRYFVHDCWPVEVRTQWAWPADALEQILAIHSRRMPLSRP